MWLFWLFMFVKGSSSHHWHVREVIYYRDNFIISVFAYMSALPVEAVDGHKIWVTRVVLRKITDFLIYSKITGNILRHIHLHNRKSCHNLWATYYWTKCVENNRRAHSALLLPPRIYGNIIVFPRSKKSDGLENCR